MHARLAVMPSHTSGRLNAGYASRQSIASCTWNLEDLIASNTQLALENNIIERYLMRMEPDLLNDIALALERMVMQEHRATKFLRAVGSTQALDSVSTDSNMFLNQGSMTAPATASYAWMKIDLKTEMATREASDLRTELARYRTAYNKRHAELKAHAHQLHESAAEVVVSRSDFEKKMKLAADMFGRGGSAERWVQFLEEWLRRSEINRETLRLRTNQLRKSEKALIAQLRIKTELRQFVRAAHVQQMQCEHSDLLKALVSRGIHYKEVKKLTGSTKLELTTFKDELLRYEHSLQEMRQAVSQCDAKIARLSRLAPPVAKEVLESYNKLHHLLKYRQNFKAPDVIEYVRAKSELDLLKKKVATMTRKRDVQHGTLVACAKKLRPGELKSLQAAEGLFLQMSQAAPTSSECLPTNTESFWWQGEEVFAVNKRTSIWSANC